MRYLVSGSLNFSDMELAEEALEDLTQEDTVLITGNAGAEDLAARVSFKVGSKLETLAPDNHLRGTDARNYALRNLAAKADIFIILYTKDNSNIEELREIGTENSLAIREYQQRK